MNYINNTNKLIQILMCYVNRFLKVELYFCSYNKPILALVMLFYFFYF